MKKIIVLITIVLGSIILSGCDDLENLNPDILASSLITSGNDFVLIYENQTLYGIGNNEKGQLGQPDDILFSSTKVEIPLELNEDEIIVSLQAGYQHAGFLTSEGRVFMWGDNTNLQVLNRQDEVINTPTEITAQWNFETNEIVTSLELGGFHTGVITSTNRVVMFGLNTSGQIGNGKTSLSVGYYEMQYALNTSLKLALGNEHSGLVVDQDIYVWGSNFNGQLGLGDVSNQVRPQRLNVTTFEEDEEVSISFGVGVSMVYTNFGNLYGFGKSVYGLLGTNIEKDIFQPISLEYLALEEDEFITDINFGYGHATFKTSSKRFLNIGSNTLSQLGTSNTTILFSPLSVNDHVAFKQRDIADIVNGGFYQMVLLVDGTIYGTGYNSYVFDQDIPVITFQKIV